MIGTPPLQPLDIEALARRVLDRSAIHGRARYLVGIAGLPGSGKSTLAAALLAQIESACPRCARLVPMDGFHLSSGRLKELGLADVKGAPQTFDAASYIATLRAAREGVVDLRFPVYDRGLHDPVMGDGPAHVLSAEVRVVITEGNYLLLDRPPWRELAAVLDECWWLDTPADDAERWLVARHVRGGRSPADAHAFYNRSDRANAQLVLAHQRPPDLCLRWSNLD